MYIGLRAGKFLVCEGLLPDFLKLARKVLWEFVCKISPQRSKIMKTFFWYNLQKTSSCIFREMMGAIF